MHHFLLHQWVYRYAIEKKRGKEDIICSEACNMYNTVSIVTLVLTLNRLFGKFRNRSECRKTGKNTGNFICNWYTISIEYMQQYVWKKIENCKAKYIVIRDITIYNFIIISFTQLQLKPIFFCLALGIYFNKCIYIGL